MLIKRRSSKLLLVKKILFSKNGVQHCLETMSEGCSCRQKRDFWEDPMTYVNFENVSARKKTNIRSRQCMKRMQLTRAHLNPIMQGDAETQNLARISRESWTIFFCNWREIYFNAFFSFSLLTMTCG